MRKFKEYKLRMLEPKFDSELTDLIIELDHLRKKSFLVGSTNPNVFFQLKNIFHTLESIGSARIEGNRTTIASYLETKITGKILKNEDMLEISNIESCMKFIDDNIQNTAINRIFLCELHKHVVKDLRKEGSKKPGLYRTTNVAITGASHTPPDYTQIETHMEELFDFLNQNIPPKYDLLATALMHHRFAWIHPFDNGNGRTIRLLTYAMLVKQGFNVHVGRILNPTAVFCHNRDQYYTALARADTGTNKGLLDWCEYMLRGLKQEIEKIDHLLNYDYLKKNILSPTIEFSLKQKMITPEEAKILQLATDKQVIKADDIRDNLFPRKIPAAISRSIRQLRDKKMLTPEKENTRKYILRFDNNYLLRGIIKHLSEKGFIALSE